MLQGRLRGVCLGTVCAAALLGGGTPARAQSAEQLQRQLEELRRLIEQQQQTIGELQDRLNHLQGQQAQVEEQVKQQAEETRETADKPLVTSTSSRMKLALSGQVSRLVNLADDGKSTKAYFVDNNISVSRLKAVATGQVTEDFSIGSVFELAISPNNSAQVSQTNED